MARRRRGDSAEAAPQEPEATSGEGPQIEVKMRGNADDVKAQLGVAAAAAEEKPRTNRAQEIAQANEDFQSALANPTFTVKVKRLRPREWQGQKINVEVWTSDLPLQFDQIQSEVATTSGGGTYKAAVFDQNGEMVAAKNFDVDGDPIIERATTEELEKMMLAGGPKDSATLTEESLERRARVSAKLLEVEQIENQLQEARAARNGGKKNAPDDGRINDLERRLTESKHQAELEARDRRHAEEMRELKALIAQNQGPSELTALITQMQKQQESSDRRFADLMKQMQDDKMNQLLQKIDNLEKRPSKEGGGMVELANTALTLKKVFGWGASEDDDEDEDDPDDDRPWWQKALDKLGDKLTPRVIDKIFSKLDGLESSGKTVSKEDFMKINEEEIAAHARKVADEEIQRLMAQDAAKKAAALPAPAAPAKVELPATPQTSTPTPAAPPPAPAAPPAAAPTPEQILAAKRCQLAAGAVAMIEHELMLRRRNYEWTYELWDNLPEDLLDRACAAPDCVSMLDVFKVEGLDVAAIDAMKAKISADPKIFAWLKRGHDELVDWKKKADADPSFDPGGEEEPENEDEKE